MDLEDSIPGERKGPQAIAYPGMVKRPLCQRSVWGQGSSGSLIRTWAFARMGESYWRFLGRAGDSVGLKFYRITPSGCRTKARMSKARAEGGRQVRSLL